MDLESGFSRRDFLRGAAALASMGFCMSAVGAESNEIFGGAPVRSGKLNVGGPVYPDDAFSRPMVDRLPAFVTLSACAIQGNVFERAVHFSENELRLMGSRTQWRFVSRDAARAALVIDERIRRRPEEISLRVRNNSAEPVTITLDINELCFQPVRENLAVMWTVGPGHEIRPGEDKTLHLALSEASNSTKPYPAVPLFPTNLIIVNANGVKAGVPYELTLSELTVRYPPAPDLHVTQLECDGSMTAGGRMIFRVAVEGGIVGRTLDIEIRRDPWVLWRVRLIPAEAASLAQGACDVERGVPWHIAGGNYTVGLVADGYRAQGPEAGLRITNSWSPELPKAERRLYNGRPTFFLDGKPTVWQGYCSADYQPGNVSEFGAHGTNVFCIPTCAGRHVNHGCEPTMIAPGRFDFGSLDERVSFSLESNPDGLIFLRASMALPRFWMDRHTEDLARVQTDAGLLVWEETVDQATSLASEAWKRDQTEALRQLMRYCKAQPWSKRLAGVLLTGEVTEEWFAWACNDGFYADYSAPNQKRFAEWLTARGTTAAPIPAPDARKRPGYDVYPDDAEGRLASAYHQYYSELTVETIGHFAEVVKQETQNRCLVGTFYGYVIQLAGESRQAIAGCSALRRVIDDPNIDFIAGIPLLDFRDLTNGYDPYTSATESILAAGKFFCDENDMFSWLHPIVWHTEFDPADPRAGAISMHRRECANDAVHGVVSQKFSLMSSWHHDARLQADFALQKKVRARALGFDRAPVEQIAFVVDESSFDWTPPESTLLNASYKQLLKCLGRTGAPVGVWLFSDLDKLPDRVKLVVVAHAAAALPEDLAKLKALLARGGRTVLVVGPVGLVDRKSGKWRPDAPAEILGLPVRVDDRPLPGKMALSADNSPVESIGALRPRAGVEGEGILRYEDGTTAGAERELAGGGRLIWCGAPVISTDLLRGWVERAGVHCYAPAGCFAHASRELVSITSPVAGEVVLHWPEKCGVEDLFDGWRASGAQTLCPFAAGQTRLFARS